MSTLNEHVAQLYLVAVSHQEVELDRSQNTHDCEQYYRIWLTRCWRRIGSRVRRDDRTRDIRYVRRCWVARKDRDREEGKRRHVDKQAGAKNQPHTKASQVIFTNNRELAARHTRPDRGKYQHTASQHHGRQDLSGIGMDQERSQAKHSCGSEANNNKEVKKRFPRQYSNYMKMKATSYVAISTYAIDPR